MPSRQSCSKLIGRSPALSRRSLSRSRASSSERSVLSRSSRWHSKPPGCPGPAWRHTFRVRLIVAGAV